MALVTSGAISIGGSTVGRSINLELGRVATATSNLNEAALRTLADKPSGIISLADFYGKSDTFVETFLGTSHNWVVPSGVTSITVRCWGGGGSGPTFEGYPWGGGGSYGGYVRCTFDVTPGETLYIRTAPGGPGREAGYGDASGFGGDGYGVFRSSITVANCLVMAGGGGGDSMRGDAEPIGLGRDGGGSGVVQEGLNGTFSPYGGLGGTGTAGGAQGTTTGSGGSAGSALQGGTGSQVSTYAGGAGGGGLYGGGGGGVTTSTAGGGGGGSGKHTGTLNAATRGSLPDGDPYYVSPRGTPGNPGMVVISTAGL